MATLRRPKRLRRVPAKFLDERAGRSPETKPKLFKCVRIGNSYRAATTTPKRKRLRLSVHKRAGRRSNLSDVKYPVHSILGHEVSEDGVTRFRLKWSPPHEEETMEPMESFHHLPRLIQKYKLREEAKFYRRIRTSRTINVGEAKFQFPKIKSKVESKLKHKAESYIPDGSERLKKIFEEVEAGNGITLWLVQFEGFSDAHFINKHRISYYFPVEACLYINECAKFLAKKA